MVGCALIFAFVFGSFQPLSLPGGIAQSESAWRQELQEIEKEMEELKGKRERFRMSAQQHELQAEQVQKRVNARKEWTLSDHDRLQMAKIEKRLAALEKRRVELVEEHHTKHQK